MPLLSGDIWPCSELEDVLEWPSSGRDVGRMAEHVRRQREFKGRVSGVVTSSVTLPTRGDHAAQGIHVTQGGWYILFMYLYSTSSASFPTFMCNSGSMVRKSLLHLAQSWSSSPDSYVSGKSFLMLSNHLRFGPLLLFPGTSITITLLPTYSSSLLNTCHIGPSNRPFVQMWMCCTNGPSRNLRLPHHKVPRRLHHLRPPSKRLAPHHTTQHVTRRPRHTINQSIHAILATPRIHLNILISITSNFFSCAFFTAHVSAPYIIAGLTTIL